MNGSVAAAAAAAVAWNQLLVKLRLSKSIPLSQFDPNNLLPARAALFVTWTLDGDLRGCIGTFTPGPLETILRKYAEISAFDDTRFDPIDASLVPHLSAGVTILGDLEPCQDIYDWEIGKHGIKAVFPGNYDATFLPEVAEEQGWDHDTTLQYLAAKAGCKSIKGAKLWRYLGIKSKLSYQEYKKLVQDF